MNYKNRLLSNFLLFLLLLVPVLCLGNLNPTPTNRLLDSILKSTNANAGILNLHDVNNSFNFKNIKEEFPTPKAIINDRNEAAAVLEEIDLKDTWVNTLSNNDIVTLPVGIKTTVSEVEYSIGIAKATIHKDYTELTVFARVRLPQTDESGDPLEIFFGANNVKLSHDGGIFGDANLVLLGDVQIPFNAGNWLLELKGGFDYKTGNTDNLTYVTIDCNGVKEMGLAAEVQFSRNLIIPVTDLGEPEKEFKSVQRIDGTTAQVPNRVTGKFNMVASGWNDIVATIDLQPFTLSKHPDKFVFNLNEATLDFSDTRTPDIPFPQHYHEKGLLLPNAELWRGVYVQSLEVSLPKTFKTSESIAKQERVKFAATNMIIDNNGVSGLFSVENIIPLDKGRTNDKKAWAFSVDYIDVELTTNRITSAAFDGQIVLPISAKKETTSSTNEDNKKLGLSYKGLISEEEYLVRVATADTLNFNVWQAKAQLLPNSFIELKVADNNFKPKAVLNGRMAISASQKESLENEGTKDADSSMVNFKGIEFQNLVLQTEAPILQVDYFGYKDEVKLANFPVSIADIAFNSNDQEAGISFDLKINLMGKSDKGFAADARLGIIGKFQEENFVQKWKYDRLDLSEINIEANMGAVKIKGGLLLMNDDPIYGNGFSGNIEGTFSEFGPITCKAIFGKREFRYWYVDAAVHGLKINAGPIQLSGFAGGAFYKMTRQPNAGPDFSPSGLSYIPNDDTGLGVKAMIFGGIPDESAISIGAGFEIEFNNNGGVNRLGFFGEAQMMKAFDIPNPVAKLTDKLGKMVDTEALNGVMDSKVGKTFLDKADDEYESEVVGEAGITAKIGMEFDFVNKSFHANMDLYVNVVGGVLQGRASGGRAGWGVFHSSEDEWYVHMGTPTDRLGLKLGVGAISAQAGGYFMLGDNIPGSPPPPAIVAEILGVDAESLNYMRDENALGDGRGFAFGTDFSIDTGDMNFLMFYARFQAGLGFDIMLKDYGQAQCVNTGDQVGINGWYANGQAYAYLQGELGINLKLFFVKKRIPIIKAGAAVLLQAKAPNPVWMRGYVGGHYDLLGGLVKGKFNFKVTIGEECEFDNASPLGGLKIISDLTPRDGETEADVFATPQAAFNMAVEKALTIPEADGDHIYKITLDEFKITDESNTEITGSLEWGENSNNVTFVPEDILPPSTPLTVSVTVGFKERVNGVYQIVMVDGAPAKETEERSFTTGGAPEYIPLKNIVYSYPVIDQEYYYPKEYNKGYIQLKQGQDYLFDDAQWKSELALISETGEEEKPAFSYNNSSNTINYSLPTLNKSTTYSLSIFSKPKNASSESASTRTENNTDFGDDNTVTVTDNNAQSVSKDGSIERIGYNFTSSAYNTFAKKIKAIKVNNYGWGKITNDVVYLYNSIDNHEAFETAELVGTAYTDNKPMIVAESDLTDNYFKQDINPILYQKYSSGAYKIERPEDPYGLPPKRALPLFTNYVTNIAYGINKGWTRTHFPFKYNLPEIYKLDYTNTKTNVLNDYVDGIITLTNPNSAILDTEYIFIPKGTYTIKVQYVLPGNKLGTSETVNFKNLLDLD
ncbi:hypothetical protein [Cellulophaga omnivescoria]|uniref:hypothetical protein n=1 Tax=Cellulophaga omnivescoria TaxID=1888890 RepID=UPI0022F079C4|nr:hypothetical protein [Cellulophaga omnivescoria]WBU89250.1 hypothetical protein PBN93_15430 [Cellulophaga omnivescoria]